MDLIGDKKVGGASVLAITRRSELLQYVQSELAKENTAPSTVSTNGTNSNTGNSTDTKSDNTAKAN